MNSLASRGIRLGIALTAIAFPLVACGSSTTASPHHDDGLDPLRLEDRDLRHGGNRRAEQLGRETWHRLPERPCAWGSAPLTTTSAQQLR